MRVPLYITLLIVLIIGGCSTPKPLISPISDVLIFPIEATIGIVDKGNKFEADSALSNKNGKELSQLIPTFIPAETKYSHYNITPGEIEEFKNAYQHVVKIAEKQETSIKIITAPKFLLDILEKQNKTFGLCILSSGFIRSQSNLANQQLRSAALYFGSLGTYQSKPYKSASGLLGFIVDRNSKKIKFYSRVIWKDKDPTDTIVLKRQAERLIQKCFKLKV